MPGASQCGVALNYRLARSWCDICAHFISLHRKLYDLYLSSLDLFLGLASINLVSRWQCKRRSKLALIIMGTTYANSQHYASTYRQDALQTRCTITPKKTEATVNGTTFRKQRPSNGGYLRMSCERQSRFLNGDLRTFLFPPALQHGRALRAAEFGPG